MRLCALRWSRLMEFRRWEIRSPQRSASVWCNWRHVIFYTLFCDFHGTIFCVCLVPVSLPWTAVRWVLPAARTVSNAQTGCGTNSSCWSIDRRQCIRLPSRRCRCDIPLSSRCSIRSSPRSRTFSGNYEKNEKIWLQFISHVCYEHWQKLCAEKLITSKCSTTFHQ